MRYTPGDNALEFNRIVGDGADFHQLGFDDFRFSHRVFSMAHPVKAHLSEMTSTSRRRSRRDLRFHCRGRIIHAIMPANKQHGHAAAKITLAIIGWLLP